MQTPAAVVAVALTALPATAQMSESYVVHSRSLADSIDVRLAKLVTNPAGSFLDVHLADIGEGDAGWTHTDDDGIPKTASSEDRRCA